MSPRVAATTLVLSSLLGLGAVATAAPASACQPESCPPPNPACQLLDRLPKAPHCIPVY